MTHVKWLFVDDARQAAPGRPGMRPLVGVGGVVIDGTRLRSLCERLDAVCVTAGFPARPDRNAEFKWSPGKELWMRGGLVGDGRAQFFASVLAIAKEHEASAILVAVDTKASPAHTGKSHEMDALLLLLERFHKTLGAEDGVVVCDTPGGDRADEADFLSTCITTLSTGTDYVKFRRLALPVMTGPSHLVRPLQLADVITSCTLAFIAGEKKYAPATFAAVKPLLRRDGERIAGYGVKIHPDYRYANLYHWLLGDTDFWKGSTSTPLPIATRSYATGPDEF